MVQNHDNPLEIHGKLSWKFHIQFMHQWKWEYGIYNVKMLLERIGFITQISWLSPWS